MSVTKSPLRYPGGKQILSRVLAALREANGIRGGVYAEPYAGGAGAALNLLMAEHVDRILINDADPSVFSFWKSVLHRTDDFLNLLWKTPLTDNEWVRQRDIYRRRHRRRTLEIGFATFYLNRCNRSGIIANAGPIGGRHQKGKWKIDARFNRDELARRIEQIALYRDRIEISGRDAIDFLRENVAKSKTVRKTFVYLDPPYFHKGRDLYLNYYLPADHAKLASYLRLKHKFLWVMSYDNVPEIRELYRGFRAVPFDLSYSASSYRTGSEVLIAPQSFQFPPGWKRRIPQIEITSSSEVRGKAA